MYLCYIFITSTQLFLRGNPSLCLQMRLSSVTNSPTRTNSSEMSPPSGYAVSKTYGPTRLDAASIFKTRGVAGGLAANGHPANPPARPTPHPHHPLNTSSPHSVHGMNGVGPRQLNQLQVPALTPSVSRNDDGAASQLFALGVGTPQNLRVVTASPKRKIWPSEDGFNKHSNPNRARAISYHHEPGMSPQLTWQHSGMNLGNVLSPHGVYPQRGFPVVGLGGVAAYPPIGPQGKAHLGYPTTPARSGVHPPHQHPQSSPPGGPSGRTPAPGHKRAISEISSHIPHDGSSGSMVTTRQDLQASPSNSASRSCLSSSRGRSRAAGPASNRTTTARPVMTERRDEKEIRLSSSFPVSTRGKGTAANRVCRPHLSSRPTSVSSGTSRNTATGGYDQQDAYSIGERLSAEKATAVNSNQAGASLPTQQGSNESYPMAFAVSRKSKRFCL